MKPYTDPKHFKALAEHLGYSTTGFRNLVRRVRFPSGHRLKALVEESGISADAWLLWETPRLMEALVKKYPSGCFDKAA